MPDANITKSALARSMKTLMVKKGFAKISVTDICDECGMNRKSFYYHFKDKYDLMNWIFYTDFISLTSKGEFTDGWGLLKSVCELFYNDQDFYKSALLTEGQNSFSEYLYEMMEPFIMYISDDLFMDDNDKEELVPIFCELWITLLTKWLERGCILEPKKYVEAIKLTIMKMAAGIE